jgi:alkylation response protein AidB-like acyl-CoA dehydrogenase
MTTASADSQYSLTQEQLDFQAMVRQMTQERITPRAAEIDAKAEYPWDIRELFKELDIFGLPFDEEYGGTGTGTLMLNVAIEEISKGCASCGLMLAVHELSTLPIKLFGSDELKQRVLTKCAAGEWTGAFALSEPDAGSDPGGMRTHAVLDGDEWVINGEKNWITNSSVADFYIVFAVTDRESRRVTAFVVEKDRPGFSIGKLEHKMGIKGSPTGSPVLQDVRVPQENVVGEVGRGLSVALGTLDHSRLGVAAQAVGIAQGATDYAVGYAKERTQFKQPIFNFQAIQHKLADMETRTAAARELLYRASVKVDADDADKGKYSAMAKVFAGDTAMAVTVEAVQVLGGYGYVTEYPVERMMRDAKITQIYEGTQEVQRLVIARYL